MKNINAFTLAEVLIVLGIIGVIAAMTLPVLIKSYEQQKTINQLKKAYSVLNQAFKMSEIDNDTAENWSSVGDIGVKDYTNKYWKPYLKVIKVCNSFQECGYSNSTPWINANKTNISITSGNGYCIMTSDGVLLFFRSYLSGTIFVDLNGPKRPNKLGNDLFVFVVKRKGVVPPSLRSDYAYCNKTLNNVDNGVYCSGVIIYNGWKIPKDYPW